MYRGGGLRKGSASRRGLPGGLYPGGICLGVYIQGESAWGSA